MTSIFQPLLKRTLLTLLWLFPTATPLLAGKPWRPGLDRLVPESELIVLGKVTRIEPSLVTDKDGNPCFLAVIRVTGTLKGTPPKTLLVTVPAEPLYDAKGNPMLISTAYLYDLKAVEHSFVLFLRKPGDADVAYYVPAGSGSGIVDLDRERPGDGPEELDRLRAYLREAK